MHGSRCALLGSLLALGACSLTTSFDGLSGGQTVSLEGGTPEGGDAQVPSAEGGAEAGEGGALDYRGVVLSDAPLGYWRLGDTGAVAKDEVGAHDGTYKGGVTHTAGAVVGDADGAAVFDGTSGYVDVGDALPFLGTAPFTIEAWASPTPGATDPACVAAKAFAPGGTGGSLSDGYTFYLDSGSNRLELSRYQGNAHDNLGGPSLSTGRFSHVAATYDGAKLALWVDGVLVGEGGSTLGLTSISTPLTLGAGRGGIYCYFRGALDEIAIYGTALGSARIGAHYHAGIGK